MILTALVPDFIMQLKGPFTIPIHAFVCQQMTIELGTQMSLAAYAERIELNGNVLTVDILDSTAHPLISEWINSGAELRPLFVYKRLISFTISKRIY